MDPKRFLILIFLLTIVNKNSFSQFSSEDMIHPGDSVHQAYLQRKNEIFANVDLSLVPSGLLYDFGISFINLEPFVGNLTVESKSTKLSFGLAYASLFSMMVSDVQPLPDPSYYRSFDSINKTIEVMHVMGLHIEYDKLDTLSIENGLISALNDNLYDNLPRTQSPYYEQDLFMFAPANHYIYGGTTNLKIDSSLFYTNTDKIILNIAIDLDDGIGFISTGLDEVIPLPYTEKGRKNIKIRITYTDNSVYFSNFDLFIKGPFDRAQELSPNIVHHISPTFESNSEDGRGGGTVNVFLACGHTQIEKPFIWAEGFNPIVGALNLGLSVQDALDRINRIETLIDGKVLGQYLEQAGYDIIVLDYDDGGDYLPRTSEFIKESIRWINLKKHASGSNEKNIIIGQSMGGICTNLALKEMEVLSSEDHEVSTFIIFDSPIMGANVPLCGQASLIDIALLPVYPEADEPSGYVLSDFVGFLDDGLDLILLPATRTMMTYFELSIPLEFQLREDYYDYQHNVLDGGPENCEVITIANGSNKGALGKHNFSPGDKVVQANLNTFTVLSLLGGFINADFEEANSDIVDSELAFSIAAVAVWGSGLQVDLNIDMWAVADNDYGVYYQSSIYVNTWWDFIDGDIDPLIYSEITRGLDGVSGIDCAPGGFVGIGNQGIILDGYNLGDLAPSVFKLQTWCFTPTVSVLNYHGPYTDNSFFDPLHDFTDNENEIIIGNTKNVDNYVSNSVIDNFGTASDYENTAHTWFTNENTKFMMYHLIGTDMLEGIAGLNTGISFNYGRTNISASSDFENSSPRMTSSILDHSITITGTDFAVNVDAPIGLTPSAYPPPNTPGNSIENSGFILNIGNACNNDDPITVIIENGSQFILGDGDSRTGAVHVNDNHTVIIKNGGTLIINEGSAFKLRTGATLIIEDGGELIVKDEALFLTEIGSNFLYHVGAETQLLGSGATMDLTGTLFLFPNADFNPKHPGVSSGRVVVRAQNGLISGGSGSKFQLIGDGDSDNMLTIMEGAKLSSEQGMEIMRFRKCKITIRTSEWFAIRSLCPFESIDVTYQVQANLVLDDFRPTVLLHDESSITACDFTDVRLKSSMIYFPGLVLDPSLNLLSCNFNSTYANDENQIRIEGGSFDVSHCDFSGFSGASIFSINLVSYSSMTSNNFYGTNGFSKALVDWSAVEIRVENTNIQDGDIGIFKADGKLTLRCNHFDNISDYGVFVYENCFLEMGPGGSAGYNVFEDMGNINIGLYKALNMQLSFGYNTFDDNANPTIKGSIQIGYPGQAKQYLHAKKNKWNLSNTEPLDSKIELTSSISNLEITLNMEDPQNGTCGQFDTGFPISDFPGNKAGLPLVKTPLLTDSTRLDSAIAIAYKHTERCDPLKDDIEAIQIYYDLLMYDYDKKNKITKSYLDYAFYEMKRTVEHCFSTKKITKYDNAGFFHPAIQLYVDVLNHRSKNKIKKKRYAKQFCLEMDKVHLYRMIGHNDIALNILYNTEACGLKDNEQRVVNHWKFVIEEEIVKQVIGPEYEEFDTIITDTSGYFQPEGYSANRYYFGTTINGLFDIEYRSCENPKSMYGSGAFDEDQEKSEFSIYPNPSNGIVNIEYNLPENSIGEFVVYGLDGKEVYRFLCQEGSRFEVVDISFVQSGAYFYSYLIDGESVDNGKMIVNH